MNPRLWLTASVLLNVAALGALGVFLGSRPAAAPASVPTPAKAHQPLPATAPAAAKVQLPMAVERFDWRQVETPDYRQYIANLRAIGCPEPTIRDIIVADVCKLYADKRAALLGQPRIFHYWESSESQYTRENLKYQAAVADLEKEKAGLVSELLGADLREELAKYTGAEPRFDRSIAFLPPGRREAFANMLDRYRNLERAIYSTAKAESGELSGEEKRKLEDIDAQRRQEIATLLSPEEQREYAMSNDRLARTLRANLNGFQPSEQEFLALWETRKALEENFPPEQRKKESPEQRAARQAAEQQAEATLQTLLGADRYAEYQRTQSDGYDDLYRTAKRYDLPKEAITAVADMKAFANTSYQTILKDPGLTLEQKAAALKDLAKSTALAAQATLGKDAYKYYVSRDGKWLARLSAPLAPPKPKLNP